MIRTIALALAATLGTATLASADSYFGIIERQGSSGILELGTVRSAEAGTVQIFDGDRLLGETSVTMGANTNVRVSVGTPPNFDVTAVLLGDSGAVLDTQRIDIDRDDM